MLSKFLRTCWISFLLSFLFLLPVRAYIDPATTSYIIQIIAGLAISLSVVTGIYWRKFLNFFRNLRITITKAIILLKRGKISRPVSSLRLSEPKPELKGTTKLFDVLSDHRTYKERLLISGYTVIPFTFSFILFSMIDVYLTNIQMIDFSLKVFLPTILMMFFLISIAFTLIFPIFKGKIFDFIISFAVGLTLAGYIQGNFLNLKLGQLTGDPIPWHQYRLHGFVNLLIWGAIISIPFIVKHFMKAGSWKKFVSFTAVLLILMQSVGLIFSAVKAPSPVKKDKYLSYKAPFKLSSHENIVMLFIDRLDTKYVDEVLKDDPHFLNGLDGFTYYENSVSTYCRTFPAVSSLFTDKLFLYDYPAKKYLKEAWENPQFFNDLKANNFISEFYTEQPYVFGDASNIESYIDNVVDHTTVNFNNKFAFNTFSNLSAYRYLPHLLKPSFWLSGDEFKKISSIKKGDPLFVSDDPHYYERLIKERISSNDSKNKFIYYHLNGSHAPYNMDENAKRVENGASSVLKQTKGSFKIVYEYLDQMKKLGIYENSTIVILGDHPKSEDIYPLDNAKTTAFMIKPKGISGKPFQTTDFPFSYNNVLGTILDAHGIDSPFLDRSIYRIKKEDNDIRKFYYRVNSKAEKPGYLQEFNVSGDARDFKNWTLVDTHEVKFPYM